MNTPIWDFLQRYQQAGTARFHMPGHKGVGPLGCEVFDLTEVQGADALYEAEGIIAQSEQNASALFGSRKTVYSAEGSSQCIRAMLYLALTCRPRNADPVIVAARNVHKAFVYGAALLDIQVQWLWPEGEHHSVCGCPISPAALKETLKALPRPPAAVYITSPDYLGSMADIPALAEVCHRYGTILMVDNAHGAYLRFLQSSRHPLELGADLCCDSAHKTLPVLTGGAYLHLGKNAPKAMDDQLKAAMVLFGSTSPSYLIMASLDLCNRYLADGYVEKLTKTVELLQTVRKQLRDNGWQVEDTDPLRLTISAASNLSGIQMAQILSEHGMECEYADPESLVLMLTPENKPEDLRRLVEVLGRNEAPALSRPNLPLAKGPTVCSIRDSFFAPHEIVPAQESLGRICGAPTVACPPAIPIAVSGERIGPAALELFSHYGIKTVDVLKES